jgi:mycofactocin precursor
MSEPTQQATAEPEVEPAPGEAVTSDGDPTPGPLVEDELLVEDVSIDGMCGVY